MKIVLINPPIKSMLQTETPKFVGQQRGYNPPMGIISMATVINQKSNHTAKVLDTQVLEMSYEDMKRYIQRENPDIVGISAITFLLIDAVQAAKTVKEVDSSIKVIFGGPHATLFPYETMKLEGVDFVLAGEGELSFPSLLDALEKDTELSKVPGLYYKDNGEVKKGLPSSKIEDLDELPIPDRTLTPWKLYSSVLAHANPLTTAVTSRGCPFRCTFCDRPQMGGKSFRARSSKLIVDELEKCQELGIKEVMFYDDTFTMIQKRTEDMCKQIKERGIDILWDCRTRVDRVDRSLIKLMKQTGCVRVNFGVESGTEKGLQTVKKNVTLQQVKDAFKISREENMETLGYFMIGLPGESKEEMLQTINFAKSVKPNYLHFTVLTPFPDTQIWNDLIAKGDTSVLDAWRNYAKNPSAEFQAPTANEHMNKQQLFELCNQGYKSFYLRPSYVFQELLRVRSFGEFKRKAKAGLNVMASS